MSPHKFSIGQKVSFRPGDQLHSHLGGTYTIVQKLPSENREWQYRAKSDRDQHERILLESQLTA